MSWLFEQAEARGLAIPTDEATALESLARLREHSAPS